MATDSAFWYNLSVMKRKSALHWLSAAAIIAVAQGLFAGTEELVADVSTLARRGLSVPVQPALFDVTCVVAHVSHTPQGRVSMAFTDGAGSAFARSESTYSAAPCRAGDTVRARGRVRNISANLPALILTDIERIRGGTPPEPKEASLRDIADGMLDWRWVKTHGLVRDVIVSETNARFLIFILAADGVTLPMSVPAGDMPPDAKTSLLGRTISACGFPNPQSGSARSYLGRVFQCFDGSLIEPTGPERADPFDAIPVQAIAYANPDTIATLERVKAKGWTIAQWQGNKALIRCANGSVMALECDGGAPPGGSCIEASGFPCSDLFHLTLLHAVWRSTSQIKAFKPRIMDISAAEFFSAPYDGPGRNAHLHGKLVRMRAVVRNIPDGKILNNAILVENSNAIIRVELAAECDFIADVSPGCEVEITGTCVLDTDFWRPNRPFPQIRGFSIVVNDPMGLRVLSRPSWWTAERTRTVTWIVLAFFCGALIWVRILNSIIRRKSLTLMREQLEHEKSRLKTAERTRLAVELHDSIAQSLTGVSLEIDIAERTSDGAPECMRTHLKSASGALKACRDELKNCLWDLRNNALEAKGMDEAISQTLAPHIANANVHVDFAVPRARLTDNTAHVVLRILRELVINAVRHGHAGEIWITGSLNGALLKFSVRDNGCGFDPASAPGFSEGHYGLLGIQERIDEFEGEFEIDSHVGGGTTATISFHLQNEPGGAFEGRP